MDASAKLDSIEDLGESGVAVLDVVWALPSDEAEHSHRLIRSHLNRIAFYESHKPQASGDFRPRVEVGLIGSACPPDKADLVQQLNLAALHERQIKQEVCVHMLFRRQVRILVASFPHRLRLSRHVVSRLRADMMALIRRPMRPCSCSSCEAISLVRFKEVSGCHSTSSCSFLSFGHAYYNKA